MTTLNFDNTQNAFAYKPNYELIRDYQIFRLINQGWLVKFGTRAASKMMDAGFKIPVAIGMRPTIYAVFCGGDTLPLATKKINQLYQYKVQSILDYGVEGKESEEDFQRTENAIKEAILFAKDNDAVDIVCSKFTGLIPFSILEKLHANEVLTNKENEIYQAAKDRIYSISKLAFENNVSLFVDAEESWIQQPLDDLTFELMREFNKEKPIIYNHRSAIPKRQIAVLKRYGRKSKASRLHLCC
jgi:proline dehydrogenase